MSKSLKFGNESIIFREAAESDIDLVASLFNLKNPTKLTDTRKVFIGLKNNEIFGFLEIIYVFAECDVIHIEIIKKFQRQGFGKKLFEFCILKMREKGVKVIFLDVRKSNIPAINLYRKLGFSEMGLRRKYYKNPDEDAILMVKNL